MIYISERLSFISNIDVDLDTVASVWVRNESGAVSPFDLKLFHLLSSLLSLLVAGQVGLLDR